MPWTSTEEGTLPSLKNKAQEYRDLFAKVANKALQDGRSEDEAITAGLGAVSALERKKGKELRKQLTEQMARVNHVPEHVRVLQQAKLLKEQQQREYEEQQEAIFKEKVQSILPDCPEISEMYFDRDGYLIVKYSDGRVTKTKNAVPEEVINKYINVSVNDSSPEFDLLQVSITDGVINEVGNLYSTEKGSLTVNKLVGLE